MKKILFIICVAIMGMAQLVNASSEYRYVSSEELKGCLEAAQPVLLVDIQEKKAFAAHHIRGSIETNAYPIKSETDRQLLTSALLQIQAREHEDVVVVCPRGKGGAERTYDYLKEQGIPETRLFILTGGMEKWPHKEWVDAK